VDSGYWETYEHWPEKLRPEPEWAWDVDFPPKYWMHLPELPK